MVTSDKIKQIIIPELEEISKNYIPRGFSEDEKAIIMKYYNRVPIDVLLKYLPGRDKFSVQRMASKLGATKNRNNIPHSSRECKQ